MTALGTMLSVLIGSRVAVPAPATLVDVLDDVEVVHSDDQPSAFQMSFLAGRSGPADLLDYALLTSLLLKPFHRVVLVVTVGAVPQVLFDGVITHVEVSPSPQPGGTRIRVTGDDLTAVMDLDERSVEHPAQDETVIATKIIASYGSYGLIPQVVPPTVIDPPVPTERTPVQQGTDLAYLRQMADRHGYVFYILPGPVPMTSTGYWGPPKLLGVPQRAVSVNMGAHSNATISAIRNDARSPETVDDEVQDRLTNERLPVVTAAPLRPPLALFPSWVTQLPHVRTTKLRTSGLTTTQAFARAQARTDASADTVTVSGELDADTYGDILRSRGLVGVRGAGFSYDGLYYVKSVTHRISRGAYTQSFTLTRDGVGSTVPAVLP